MDVLKSACHGRAAGWRDYNLSLLPFVPCLSDRTDWSLWEVSLALFSQEVLFEKEEEESEMSRSLEST